MTRGECRDKINQFINKLARLDYKVERVSRNPQIYRINGVPVNIRCTKAVTDRRGGSRVFWYSIYLNVLSEVDYVIYLETDFNYFVKLPSALLKKHAPRMYPDRRNPNVGVFHIDWDDLTLELKDGRENIFEYAFNLIENYPKFP